MSLTHGLHDTPAASIDYDLVRQFVLDAEAANLLTESLTLEIKTKRSGSNVADAVAALSNTDGGLVLVGVAEKEAEGEDRLVGVPREEHDRLVGHLQSLIPTAMPEIIPVRIPGGNKIVIVLRVNADSVLHPVLVAGRVLLRVPGATVPADRQRVVDLINRDRGVNQGVELATCSRKSHRHEIGTTTRCAVGRTSMPHVGGSEPVGTFSGSK